MKHLSATIKIGQLLLKPIDQLFFQLDSLLISCGFGKTTRLSPDSIMLAVGFSAAIGIFSIAIRMQGGVPVADSDIVL